MSSLVRFCLLSSIIISSALARTAELPDVDLSVFSRSNSDDALQSIQPHGNGFLIPRSNVEPSKRQTGDSVLPTDLNSVPFQRPSSLNVTNGRTSEANLAFSLIDHEFTDIEKLVSPNMPLTFACKNCSTTGSMVLTRGEFSLANVTELMEEVIDSNAPVRIFESGTLELQVNGFSAHVELDTSLAKSFSHSTTLFKAPLFGYSVPGFGILGVFFEVPLLTSLTVSGGLEFTYGFDVTVPDNATILIDFANMGNSRTTGFDKAQITALPFQANLTATDLQAHVALQPAVVVGFEFDEEALGSTLGATAKAGVFLDLPSLTADVKIGDSVDENCNPVTKKSTASQQSLLSQLGDLTHITPTVEVDLGVEAQFALAVSTHSRTMVFPTTLLSAQETLPTACLAFDQNAKTLAPASVLYASLSSASVASSISAAAASSSSAAAASAAAWTSSTSAAAMSSAVASQSAAVMALDTARRNGAGALHPPLLHATRDFSILANMTAVLMLVSGLMLLL